MRLVFLHGAPATGKLTVARALLSLLPGRLLENHAANGTGFYEANREAHA